jgi:hypothetical protein
MILWYCVAPVLSLFFSLQPANVQIQQPSQVELQSRSSYILQAQPSILQVGIDVQ